MRWLEVVAAGDFGDTDQENVVAGDHRDRGAGSCGA
jgi:hypothetical protein